jgi:small subunit ribosomal protein S16
MLMIRLARFGAKKKPTYRLVVIDKERARNSRAVEIVGHYDPVSKPKQIVIKHERGCGRTSTYCVAYARIRGGKGP